MIKIKNGLSGGQILADQLRAENVDTVFCVPGESHLALLDGLYQHRNAIKVVSTRHEGAAANMAEAYGKLTGKPGICLVTRGPGATHASVGLHTGFQDSTPMILLIGQIGRGMADREAFQEIDYRRMFGEMGGSDRRCRPDSRIYFAGISSGHVGPSGSCRFGAARGYAAR